MAFTNFAHESRLTMNAVIPLLLILSLAQQPIEALTSASIITGGNGYVGRAVIHELVDTNPTELVCCLVRPGRVLEEEQYWETRASCVRVFPYDMLDEGVTMKDVLQSIPAEVDQLCVYHVAAVFGPTEDHKETALGNVKGTEDLIRVLSNMKQNVKFVLVSSMAAVRGTGQTPSNGKFYTANDWNTLSQLGANWGASYQWSKAESERKAWELCTTLNIPMVSLCPSFVFGPPSHDPASSSSYSLQLVGQWARGEGPVQSRLFVDVRDVAKAIVAAGVRQNAVGKRFIVSSEARVPSSEIAIWLREVCRESNLSDPEKVYFDADFDGGAIPIGEKEVDAEEHLRTDLGVTLRSVKDTIMDMAQVLLQKSHITQ